MVISAAARVAARITARAAAKRAAILRKKKKHVKVRLPPGEKSVRIKKARFELQRRRFDKPYIREDGTLYTPSYRGRKIDLSSPDGYYHPTPKLTEKQKAEKMKSGWHIWNKDREKKISFRDYRRTMNPAPIMELSMMMQRSVKSNILKGRPTAPTGYEHFFTKHSFRKTITGDIVAEKDWEKASKRGVTKTEWLKPRKLNVRTSLMYKGGKKKKGGKK